MRYLLLGKQWRRSRDLFPAFERREKVEFARRAPKALMSIRSKFDVECSMFDVQAAGGEGCRLSSVLPPLGGSTGNSCYSSFTDLQKNGFRGKL